MILESQHICVADVPNKNNRIYPKAVLEQLVLNQTERPILGTFGPEGLGPSGIDLDAVSHVVTNLRMEDNVLVGDVRVLQTPKGQILEQLHAANVTIHFRLVGHCDLQVKLGSQVVQNNYQLLGIFATLNGA